MKLTHIDLVARGEICMLQMPDSSGGKEQQDSSSPLCSFEYDNTFSFF